MSGRIRGCTSHERQVLTEHWELAATPPAAALGPQELASAHPHWSPAVVPGTAASSLRATGLWSVESAPRRFDAEDWWYRTRFDAAAAGAGERVVLGFDGLATLAQVWLNGTLVLQSSNMFVEHRCDVGALLVPDNELLIRFASIDALLAQRRRRPRWRTPMVGHPQLRWVRTTLLGRTPGWSPPAAAVGPWRPVWLERRRLVDVAELRLQAAVQESQGRLSLTCEVEALGGATLKSARFIAERSGRQFAVPVRLSGAAPPTAPPSAPLPQASRCTLQGDLRVADPDLWWPHTHGDPALYGAILELVMHDPGRGGEEAVALNLGSVGFRSLRLDRGDGDFALSVNGRRIFCRGACWTPLDCISLQAGAGYDEALGQVGGAGMNMLRVAGPMVYESDEFLDLCDSRGILLWQDFMFANMDYPDDADFAASVADEARQQLARLQARPSLAVLCGNSEAAQQAAMSGGERANWAPRLFESDLAAVSKAYCADVPYCPSSTHGGSFPHRVDAGVTSYYGVGAYLLPIGDARRSGLRFASECLAFANVPENETLATLARGEALRCHHPRWKERVPRDMGAGWDFDDVRDHYLSLLFRLDAMPLRYADHERYLRLARATSGEVMSASFAEWRRVRSGCRGALVWFLRDLWPGAGWGVIDSTGLPKAPYYTMKRVLQPLALFITDEGTNGLMIHIANDGPGSLRARIELSLFRHSEPVGTVRARELTIDAACGAEFSAVDWYEGFVDLSYVHRFGPPSYDVLTASLKAESGATLAEAFHFPLGLPNGVDGDPGLSASATALDEHSIQLDIRCARFAQSVHVEMPGFVADDQYFHMAPGSSRRLTLRARAGRPATPEGWVFALNTASVCRVAMT